MTDDATSRDAPAEVDGYNAGYAERLYEESLRERGIVPPSLAEWTGDGREAVREEAPAPPEAAPGPAPAEQLRLASVAGSLVAAYRDHGHLAARIDPFESEPTGHPLLEPAFYDVSEEELARVPAAVVGQEALGENVAEVLARLREIYCGRIGYELDHIDEPEKRDWLIERIESGDHRPDLSDEEAVALLRRLSEVEGLERFLHRAYLGKKRFSIEGVDMLVPMLDEVLGRAATDGTREVILGMAHRGRLNVLAHIIGRPYSQVVAEFEGDHGQGVGEHLPEEGAGDVKYHLGAAGVYERNGTPMALYLAPNPSHLEHVDPVMEGMARAARDLRVRGQRARGSGELPGPGDQSEAGQTVLPVLVHGDAAFMGQGVVAETLNLHRLEGYETGGTVHVIADNQLGFTTPPEQGRSTRNASDLALGFRIPVIHVNADHPEACLAAARLAYDYRNEFGRDILIDLVGYRRHGHNEGDEPSYTQPGMYREIDDHPTVRTLWADRLLERGAVSEEQVEAFEEAVADRLSEAREAVAGEEGGAEDPGEGSGAAEGASAGDGDGADAGTASGPSEGPGMGGGRSGGVKFGGLRPGLTEPGEEDAVDTSVGADRLLRLNEEIHRWPEDVEPLEKLASRLRERKESLEEGEPMDWAHGEALAFASLVTDGVAVRLAGEDSVRGTFSQRHLRLHDRRGRGSHMPLAHLEGAEAPFEAWNSPLSEVAALGFEYGYSAIATESLVLWEAQFGDFANVGQAIIDQFVVAGRSKWGQESRLCLLLPHGYEGQGPEHSSARLERFLQLGGRENIRVAYPTTPGQYFHLLRLQALRGSRRPLVVMTPKSLLRHPRARSGLEVLAQGGFRPVLRESGGDGSDDARRLLLCSGKVYYDLVGSDAHESADEVALARLELLYPFPESDVAGLLEGIDGLEEVLWVQEEPENMGAWDHVRPRLRELLPAGVRFEYAGRPEMASPAEGYASQHQERQTEIVERAYGPLG